MTRASFRCTLHTLSAHILVDSLAKGARIFGAQSKRHLSCELD